MATSQTLPRSPPSPPYTAMENKYSVVFPELPATPASIAHLLASSPGITSDIESRIAQAHIHNLESHLTSVQNLIALSLERAADLECSIQAHRAILSPIRRLPNEILAEIFSQAARAAFNWGDISETRSPVTSQAPWVFTHVCRLWAEVALESRSLWSRIFINLDAIDWKARGVVSILKLFLERSGNMPLTVQIFNEARSSYLQRHRALDAALAHVERWEHVDLYVTWPILLFNVAAMRGDLSSLKTLRIVSRTEDDLDASGLDAGDFSDTFAIAPNLTALRLSFLDSATDVWLRPPFEFPWQQLARLSMTFPSNFEALTTLEELSSIVELIVEFDHSGEDPALRRSCVTLPHLRVLEIINVEHMSSHPLSYLLDFLAAPVLERLVLQATADQRAVLRFVTRSGCAPSLKSFHFIHSVTAASILPILKNMPHLDDVEIGDLNGALLAESSVSGVVDILWSHWHGMHTNADASLSVKLVDSQCTERSFVPVVQEVDGLHISFGQSRYLHPLLNRSSGFDIPLLPSFNEFTST